MASLPIVISDATPLIALSKIGHLHHLAELFGEIYLPLAVYKEITISGQRRSGAREVAQASWIAVHEIQDRTKVNYLLSQLDIGEAEAMVLAQEISASLVLVDERKARTIAQRLGFQVMGTAGLLLLLKQQGRITYVRPLLDRLRSLNFRLGTQVYNQVISKAGE